MQSAKERQTFCRLCFCSIIDTNFKVIEEVVAEVLKVVLPGGVELEVEIYEPIPVICGTCSVKLFAALSFKSICLDTEDVIFPYITSEVTAVDLKDVYLKEKRNAQLTDISEDKKICRLCFQLITEFVPLNEVDVDIIDNYIPQINISATKQPFICGLCFNLLSIHGSFVKNCLDARAQYIQSYIKVEEINIKEESDQDRDSCSDESFEGNNKQRCITGQIEITKGNSRNQRSKTHLNTLPIKAKLKNKPANDLKRKNAPKQKNHIPNKYEECIHKCESETTRQSNILDHIVRHKNNKDGNLPHKLEHENISGAQMHRCDICAYDTNKKRSLKLHQLIHINPSEVLLYKCDRCSYASIQKTHLKRHQLKHKDPTEVTMHKCGVCDFETKYRGVLRQHQIIHKDPFEIQTYKCEECSYKSIRKNHLNCHKLKHKNRSEIQMYKCHVCSYECRFKTYLLSHLLTHKDPSEVRMYKCDECTFESKYRKSLKNHLLTHRDPSEIQMYKCHVCSYESRNKTYLIRHMVRHKDPSDVLLYKCDTCSYASKQKFNLKRHQLIHKDSTEIPSPTGAP